MRKSKKHTVTLSSTSSFDKLPNSNIELSKTLNEPVAGSYSDTTTSYGGISEQEAKECLKGLQNFKDTAIKNAKEALDAAFTISSASYHQWNPDDFQESDILLPINTSEDIPVSETIFKFKECIKTYPRYVSDDTSTVLNVAVAVNNEVLLDKLPENDKQIINEQLDALKIKNIIRNNFKVNLDADKDFELIFEVEDEDKNITTVRIRLFNSIIHPENPVSDFRVPVNIDGELVTNQSEDTGIKIKDGVITIKDNLKGKFQYLAGISKKIPVYSNISPKEHKTNIESIDQPVVIKNKNAYEIRLAVLENSIKWMSLEDGNSSYHKPSTEELLALAKKFYSFVENK